MTDHSEIIEGLKMTLNGIDNLRGNILRQLTESQENIYREFESSLYLLMKKGDHVGVEKLKEEFKKRMNDNV